MSAANCHCMGSSSAPPFSMEMASCQIPQLPCPCTKCKERARERHEAQIQAIAKSKSGICGQCVKGMQIGRSGPGVSSKEEPCQCPGSKTGPAMGPGKATGMGPSCTKDNGFSPIEPDTTNSPKCPHEGTKEVGRPTLAMGPNSPRQSSDNSRGIAFGGVAYLRKSTMTESGYQVNEFPMLRMGCANSSDYGDEMWPSHEYPSSSVNQFTGRDTFGLPILLQGNTGILNTANIGFCRANVACNKYCGNDTGCNSECARTHSIIAKESGGGKIPATGSHRAVGIHVCSNEYINMMLTFLMEVLGILVFFSICTITFWITLGYYIFQLLIDLKNADRNVHVAVGIVFSLLILAFAITLVTHTDGSCQDRAIAIRKGIKSSATTSISSCKRCTKSATAEVKRACAAKCKKSSKPKLKTSPAKSRLSTLFSAKPKCQLAKCQKAQKSKNSKTLRSYTDCQGRAIFDRSRRNSIIIEMKQPPTWIIWLRDQANEFFNRQ